MQHTIVTYTVKPGRAEENAALVRGGVRRSSQRHDRPVFGMRRSISPTSANSYTYTPMRAARPACKRWTRSRPS